MSRHTMVLVVALAAVAVCTSAQEPDAVTTGFAILVGFPSGEEVASEGVLLVSGTVIPLAGVESEDGRQDALERSRTFTRTVDKLWSTFRLDPGRRIQKGKSAAAAVGQRVELPPLPGADVTLSATLLGFSETAATYRVVFRQEDKVLADSKVTVNRGGRAVVGGMNGDAAPYIFVIVEPDAPGGDSMRFKEGRGITAPVVVDKVYPKYPAQAREQRIQGMVVLSLLIDTDGSVLDARTLESPHPLLAGAASEAAKQWRFEPARNADGAPVKVQYAITLKFNLR